MDLGQFFKEQLSKRRNPNFGNLLDTASVAQRVEDFNERRRVTRNDLISKRRVITNSPFFTPAPSEKTKKKTPKNQKESKPEVKDERLELLLKWRANKQMILAKEKRKAKPIFKVCHSSGFSNASTALREIKGKRIQAAELQKPYTLAPSSTYKFKPPANIIPIKMNRGTGKKVKRQSKGLEPDPNIGRRTTRSQKSKDSPHVQLPLKQPRKKLDFGRNFTRELNAATISNDATTLKLQPVMEMATKTARGPSQQKNKINAVQSTNKNQSEANPKRKDSPKKRTSKAEKTPKTLSGQSEDHSTPAKDEAKIKRKDSPRKRTSKAKKTPKAFSDQSEDHSTPAIDEAKVKPNDSPRKRTSKANKTPKTLSDQSEDHCTPAKDNTSQHANETDYKTPDNNTEKNSVVYISPFVTISRGTRNARKEYHQRNAVGGTFDTPELQKKIGNSTSPKTAVLHFSQLLNNEIKHFEGLRDSWTGYKNENNPPEEACSMIDVALGQTQLLLHSKFKHFRELLHTCERGDSDPPITCVDLHGFWDVMYIQVENINKRYETLANHRSRDWEEVLPEVKDCAEVKKKTRIVKPKAKASSNLRAAIAERRKNKVNKENCEDEIFIAKPKTPKRKSRKSSLRKSLLSAKVHENVFTPPQSGKPKGILKCMTAKVDNRSRSVVFRDDTFIKCT